MTTGDTVPVEARDRGSVELRDLTRRFDTTLAVDALNLSIAPGELFGIVGPDGAGKTTTLRMLAGILRPSAGTALVAGVDVATDPEAAKSHTAYMAQRFGLYEDLTVQENLDFYADLYGVPGSERPTRLERLYAFSRLGEFTDRLAGKLSGGMKQKLSLSCCLIHQPAILLLDEPTFGVDPISRRELWLILHEMVAEGVTVVVTTSYLDEAERCDRVALLDGGRTLAVDAPAVLQRRLADRILSVESATPRPTRDVLRTSPAVTSAYLFGTSIHVVLERVGGRAEVERVLELAGHDWHAIEPITPSLEDVFMDAVADAEVLAGTGRG